MQSENRSLQLPSKSKLQFFLGNATSAKTPGNQNHKSNMSLSKEHQLYYDTLISDLLDLSSILWNILTLPLSAISALKNDAGIQQILPYFVQFIAENVPKSLLTGLRLRMTMDMAGSLLLNNEHLFIGTVFTPIDAPDSTCVVGKRLRGEQVKTNKKGLLKYLYFNFRLVRSLVSRLQAAELVAL